MKSAIVLLLLCLSNVLMAQQKQKIQIIDKMVLNDTKSPIIWIDTMKTDINHLMVDRGSFDSLMILKDSAAVRKYGADAVNGVLVMVPKKEVKVMRLPEFLELQGVPTADRTLRVCINHTLIRYPAYLIIDPSYIRTVQITPKRHWGYLEDTNSGELFLNLLTKDYDNPVL